jgi:cobalt-zinc-cadmium efflux system membrane fusion protein
MFEGRDVVFVQAEEGFVPRPVTVGRTDQAHLEIVSGLAPGEHYVSQGGFTLKAELGKESFGGDHDH